MKRYQPFYGRAFVDLSRVSFGHHQHRGICHCRSKEHINKPKYGDRPEGTPDSPITDKVRTIMFTRHSGQSGVETRSF